MKRRIGVNRVIADCQTYTQCIVTLVDDEVIDFHTFTEERPFTEWIGGTLELIRIDNKWIVKKMGQ